MTKSIEEQVEGFYKDLLKNLGIRYYGKTGHHRCCGLQRRGNSEN